MRNSFKIIRDNKILAASDYISASYSLLLHNAMLKGVLALFTLIISINAQANVTTSIDDGNISVDWNGKEIIRTNHSKEQESITIYNRQNKIVKLGKSSIEVKQNGNTISLGKRYDTSHTSWELSLTPIGENGLDVFIELQTAPNQWIDNYNFELFNLRVDTKQKELSMTYPSGMNNYVPALALQDQHTAAGICRLDIHNRLRPAFSVLSLKQDKLNKGYNVFVSSRDSKTTSNNHFSNKTTLHYRLHFSDPIELKTGKDLDLMNATHLWKDYVEELNNNVKVYPKVKCDDSKNNIVILNFFMAEDIHVNKNNPQGWIMNRSDWKDNPWEWGHEKINSKMPDSEVLTRSGFSEKNTGKPVKWVKAFAERTIREMQETNSMSTIVFRSAINPGNNYLPESHLFNPDLEAITPVDSKVRNWDYARGTITIKNSSDVVIATKKNELIHAANKQILKNTSQHIVHLKKENLTDAAPKYTSKAKLSSVERLRDGYALKISLQSPAKLIGSSVGDRITFTANAISRNPKTASEQLIAEFEIKTVHRAAIDVWAKMLADNDIEFGFLVREAMTVGQPWKQWLQDLDWSSEWQYKMFKERILWHKARFGENCRWFYLDEFGRKTPPFIIERLRNDFPNSIFIVGHPYDATDRITPGWYRRGLMTGLQKYVAPNIRSLISPETMFTENQAENSRLIKKVMNNSDYFLLTHRGARRFLKMYRKNE